MYNEDLRNKLEIPAMYDRMIVLLMTYNPHCKDIDCATDCINVCIEEAFLPDNGGYCATGMCIAFLNDDLVSLSFEPLTGENAIGKLADQIRENQLRKTGDL